MFNGSSFSIQSYDSLKQYLLDFDVIKYAGERNFVGGGVSYLSPYITHGIITVPECVDIVCSQYSVDQSEKFLMELLRKEFFMHVQEFEGSRITHEDFWEEKTSVPKKSLLPSSLVYGLTKTDRVNTCSNQLSKHGRLHNHQRMRLASWCCHRAKLEWRSCADWAYYHFLDGELSSNHLSWQWVNSTFANKPYFMNEENLTKYWPGVLDENLQGNYDDVSTRLFDPARLSAYHDDDNLSDLLVTDFTLLPHLDIHMLDGLNAVALISPWRLHHTLAALEIPTYIILDTTFLQQHPWSAKRVLWVKAYADYYNISCFFGDYRALMSALIRQGANVITDERFDPVYADVQYEYSNLGTLLPYDRILTQKPDATISKFFRYWNKCKKDLKKRY